MRLWRSAINDKELSYFSVTMINIDCIYLLSIL